MAAAKDGNCRRWLLRAGRKDTTGIVPPLEPWQPRAEEISAERRAENKGRSRIMAIFRCQAPGNISLSRDIRRAGLGGLLLVALLAAAPAPADYPVAPDVVVFCEPTLQHVMTDIAALWRSQSGVKARIFTAPTTALLLAEIAHHARDDVIIGEGDANAGAAKIQQLIKPDSLHPLGRNYLVIAAVSGSAAAADGGDSLAAIAGKETVAIVDPWAATAGADSKQALQSLGLWQKISPKSIGVVGTADAAFLLSQGKARLAIIYATDVAADPAVTIVERLRAASYPPVVYWVAETTHALSPNATKFIAFLGSAAARDRLRADGLEVAP
jgi:molybdate transport system substrate-binding protein